METTQVVSAVESPSASAAETTSERLRKAKEKIIVSLEHASGIRQAILMAETCAKVGIKLVKVGQKFAILGLPELVAELGRLGLGVYYSGTLHEPPDTVAEIIRIMSSEYCMVDVNTLGFEVMMKAAVEAARERPSENRLLVFGSNVYSTAESVGFMMTVSGRISTGRNDRQTSVPIETGGINRIIGNMTALAMNAGLDGVRCSGKDVGMVQARFGERRKEFKIVAAGIRSGRLPQAANPHKRMAAPRQAILDGATWLLIGDQITSNAKPAEAIRIIAEEMTGDDLDAK